MPHKLLVANWKMHLTLHQAQALTSELVGISRQEALNQVPLVLCVPAPYLAHCAHLTKASPVFSIGAQNLHPEVNGAFTGEIAAEMITSCGASYVLVGHSERRQYFGETNRYLARKVSRALDSGLIPIYCIGETLLQRENGHTLQVIAEQLQEGLFHLPAVAIGRVVIAYEPVWAIGTGKTATPEEAEQVHALIRQQLLLQYDAALASNAYILYGGSVKASNAAALFQMPNLNGALVGGASLQAREFLAIAKALNKANSTAN